jgi:anti-sigma factor RsiW
MHLDAERTQRLLHGELTAPDRASVRDHLAGCPDCRALLEAAGAEEDDVLALLGRLDHAPPSIDAAAVVARARGRREEVSRWAAGVVAALALAGAAYAAPGSPLAGWVRDLVGGKGGAESPAQSGGRSPAPESDAAGIAVAPGSRLVIQFASVAGGTARVSMTAESLVVVRALAGTATFASEVDRLVIEHPSPVEFEIHIPGSAPRIEIRVGERRVFLKDGARVLAERDADAPGVYTLELTP